MPCPSKGCQWQELSLQPLNLNGGSLWPVPGAAPQWHPSLQPPPDGQASAASRRVASAG